MGRMSAMWAHSNVRYLRRKAPAASSSESATGGHENKWHTQFYSAVGKQCMVARWGRSRESACRPELQVYHSGRLTRVGDNTVACGVLQWQYLGNEQSLESQQQLQ